MSEPWPCWTCTFRGGPDVTQTYYCTRPLDPMPFWLERRVGNVEPHHQRYIGTEKQIKGETANIAPVCATYERG